MSNGWEPVLHDDNLWNIEDKLYSLEAEGIEVFPHPEDTYRAFDLCPLKNLKVVILGQDPYHTPGTANGLAFSVDEGNKLPPSLKNIYKELENDLEIPQPKHGNLEKWAEQGMLLLNTALTVEKGKPGSHAEMWKPFIRKALSFIGWQKPEAVVVLWGKKAQEYEDCVPKNPVLKAAHPSPFSADKGFFGCKHFSEINRILKEQGKTQIDWNLNKE